MKYLPTIGIETHVQLRTASKLFCGCDNDSREAKPNQNVCPICSGHPGTLPVLNEQAVKLALRAGLALNGKIAEQTKFDRKNYFYPDLPKGYQITQYDQPLIIGGQVELPDGSRVGITRIHLEEDAGKLTHPAGADYSLLDLNRAGTPLIEIVSEPDITSAEQAKAYAKELYNIMRYAAVSDVDLYHGHMRFDVNISLRTEGSKQFGIRTEIKNLNSFRAVEGAVAYEIQRQQEVLEGAEAVVQETRGWDEAKAATYSQRQKEESHDYRYFPEPDLPPLVITKAMIDEIQRGLPALPSKLREQLAQKGVKREDAELLVGLDLQAVQLVLAAKDQTAAKIANWLINDLGDERPSATFMSELAGLVEQGQVSATAAKEILKAGGDSAQQAAERLGLIQVSDHSELAGWVDDVLAANPDSVSDYHAGQQRALQFLVGQVMKVSQGKANPAMVNDILKQKLAKKE
jgi:aspartyl-tRNA(Asn)/glutamyl-tRNA(Gln) amidotransferase subunit B